MAECQLPKLNTGVRFPSPAPNKNESYDTKGIATFVLFLFVKSLVHKYNRITFRFKNETDIEAGVE